LLHLEPFRESHLAQLQSLINCHLGSVVPGWALSSHFISSHLGRNPGQYVTDPWVIERRTLCALERGRLLGAVHLLRYGSDPEVGGDFQRAGEIAWFLAWPPSPPGRYLFPYSFAESAEALLRAALAQLDEWSVTKQYASEDLWLPALDGVPDQWPHVAEAIAAVGFQPSPEAEEIVRFGLLASVPEPSKPPVSGVDLRRRTAETFVRFSAMLGQDEIAFCEWSLDLGSGGDVQALAAWAEVADLWVKDDWRNQGLGSWLVQSASALLRRGGYERVILAVSPERERSGAARFYERLGWSVLTRLQRGHARPAVPAEG